MTSCQRPDTYTNLRLARVAARLRDAAGDATHVPYRCDQCSKLHLMACEVVWGNDAPAETKTEN